MCECVLENKGNIGDETNWKEAWLSNTSEEAG